jgi:hypothetical protein
MKKSILIFLGLVLSLSGVLIAVDPPSVANTVVQGDLRLPKRADLEINSIEAWPCACEADAATVDALILKGNIVLRVHNKGPYATDAQISVKVFNYRSGNELGYAKAIHLNNNQYGSYVLATITPTSPLLIKKSYGFKAEIKVTTPGISDLVTSNNTKTLNVCQYIIE